MGIQVLSVPASAQGANNVSDVRLSWRGKSHQLDVEESAHARPALINPDPE